MRLANWQEFASEDTGAAGPCEVCGEPMTAGEVVCAHRGFGMHVDCYHEAKAGADAAREAANDAYEGGR